MNLFRQLLFISLFLELGVPVLIAQPRYSNPEEYSVINGLPNNEVRCLLKDSKGYIWVGTLYGLAKYDGNKFSVFKHVSNVNSISGDVISAIFEDCKGNILVGANGLSILERHSGIWKNYLHNPNNKFSISNPGISSIAQENDSIYWIITYNGINRFNINTGKFACLNFHTNSRFISSKIVEIVPQVSISFCISATFYKFNLKAETFQVLPINERDDYNSITVFKNNIIGIKHIKSDTYKAARFNLESNKESPIISVKDANCTLFHDNENLFLINRNTIYIFDKNFKKIDNIYFQPKAISSKSKIEYFCGIKEKNGTIWIGSSEGLYKIPPRSPFHILDSNNGLPNNYIRSLANDWCNNLWVGVRQGPIFKIPQVDLSFKNREGAIESINFPDNNGDVYATNQIIELKNHNLLFVTQNTLYHFSTKKNRFTDQFRITNNRQFFSALEITDGILIGSLEKPTLFKIVIQSDKIKRDTSFRIKSIPDVVYTLFKDSNNQVWIGGEGLYKLIFPKDSYGFNVESIIPSINEINFTNNSVWNIIDIDNDRLMVCTTTNGFYIYSKITKTIQHFNKNSGLPTDFTCSVIKDQNHNFWISTKEGLSFFDLKDFSIKNYTIKNGPFSCDFNFKCCAKTNRNLLMFGSKQGIVYFNPDSIKQDESIYPLRINEFRIFDDIVRRELSDKDTIVLKHDENFFSFEFSLLDFRNPKEIHYKYQLQKYNKSERVVTDGTNSVSYTDVPPGKYRFLLTGFNSADINTQQRIEVLVIVQPAFYQTVLFKIVISLIIILILGAILLLYIRRQVLRGQLYKMELDLLRAQINPHFIFNTLTSIQHTILMNSKNVAVDHLSKFSRLMRMGLDYSRMEYIPLEKALHFYSTYVSVESVNLDEEIDFQIKVDEKIDSSKIEISPMLIQPFIENAIVHGLSPKNRDMQLLLEIVKANDLLICTIQDNGIGRAKASEIAKKKTTGHQSMGIEITKKRILLQLQSKVFSKDSVKISDNYDEYKNPIGTTVCLKIPFRLTNKIL